MILGLSAPGFALLSVLVFFAGIVDSLAGGGGLITLPAYLAAGLDPRLVLGTNKLGSCIGTTAATANYVRSCDILEWAIVPAFAAALVGSVIGSRLTLLFDPGWLRYLLLVALPALAFLFYSNRRFGHEDKSATLSRDQKIARSVAFCAPIGLYDGFFGPGTGVFLALAFSRFCRYDLLSSTARAKLLNLAANLAAFGSFLLAKRVNVGLGLAMAGMSTLGNLAGSQLGVKKGVRILRPAIALVIAGLFVKLLFDVI